MLTLFLDELKAILEQVATLSISIVLCGDTNVRLDRLEDVWTIRFTDILSSLGLEQRVDQPTHDQNGIPDVVTTRTDLQPQFIKVTDVGLSDHRLVQ